MKAPPLAALAAPTLALALVACGGDGGDETVIRSDQGTITASGEGEDATTVIQGEGGATATVGAGAGGAVAGPDYAQPYPGSRVVSTVNAPGDGAGMTTLETDADPDAIITFYRERAEAAGLTPRASMTMGETRQFGASGPDGTEFNVLVSPQGGRSTVAVTWENAG